MLHHFQRLEVVGWLSEQSLDKVSQAQIGKYSYTKHLYILLVDL